MAARARLIADVSALAASGTSHPVRVEVTADGRVMVTIMGADGRKRHASSLLTHDASNALIDAVIAARDEVAP